MKNFKEYLTEKKYFVGDCVNSPYSTSKLDKVISTAKKITKKEFLDACDVEDINIVEDEPLEKTMRKYPNDFTFYKNNDIYFFRHSAIEHFFE